MYDLERTKYLRIPQADLSCNAINKLMFVRGKFRTPSSALVRKLTDIYALKSSIRGFKMRGFKRL